MVGGSGRVSGHPGVRFEQTAELFGGWLPGSVLIRVLGRLPDARARQFAGSLLGSVLHFWLRGIVVGVEAGTEESRLEANKEDSHFLFANLPFWW